jgi:uncharacterized protein
MNRDIETLINLQEMDSQIDAHRDRNSEIPKTVNQLKAELNFLQTSIEQIKAYLIEQEVNRKRVELNLMDKATLRDTLKLRLDDIKTNKEYTALQQETADNKEAIELLETELLRIMDDIEVKNQELQNLTKRLESESAEKIQRIKILEQETAISNDQEQSLLIKRNKISDNLDKKLLKQYDRIRNSKKGGNAVVNSTNGACGGCHRKLRPRQQQELMGCTTYVLCESCGRIVIYVLPNE